MARRGRRAGDDDGPPPKPTPGPLNAPFKGLKGRIQAKPAPPPPPPPKPKAPPPPDDADLFSSAMAGVRPMSRDTHARVEGPGPANGKPGPPSEEAEALAVLSDLVTGVAHFDVADTREYVEGIVVGLDPRLVRRLRKGDFAWQRFVDLHGLTQSDAKLEVERFLMAAFKDGLRCVLIVHGRGLNSKDNIPVLKERLKVWLAHGSIGKVVLAFTTARACDGGAGALYVLLRRARGGRPLQVTEGAKR